MQKIGSLRSINPYNPFLGMWVAVSRRARGYEGRLHAEEALTREQAVRFYTINNAHLLFLEDRIGSLDEGKQADFVVIDRDLLTCPEDEIRQARAVATYLDGKRVFDMLFDLLDPRGHDVAAWLRSSFFEHHLRRYSKSRRKAPIVWQLGSGRSGIWAYAHRLTRDSLLAIANEIAAPRLAT